MGVDPSFFGVQGFAFPVVSGGAADYPGVGDVRLGVSYNSGADVGTLVVPDQPDVRAGVGYGAGGTEKTGTLSGSWIGEALFG
jgi:hypothetical protein